MRRGGRTSIERSLERIQGVVNVRMATILTLSTDNKATLAGFVPSDPSSSGLNISEYSQWSNLFAQVRLIGMETHWIPRTIFGSGGDTGSVAIGSTMGLPGTPTSASVVVDNAGSILWNINRDIRSRGQLFRLQMSTRPTWADVTAPNPGDNVGCPGGIIYYGTDLPTSGSSTSIPIVDVLVTVYVQFRSRA